MELNNVKITGISSILLEAMKEIDYTSPGKRKEQGTTSHRCHGFLEKSFQNNYQLIPRQLEVPTHITK